MIHRVHTNSVAELNRILELIQKGAVQATENVMSEVQRSTGGSSATTGLVGPAGPQGPAGADGGAANLLVGANHQVEILVGPDGSVLTNEYGYALMGVNVTTTIMTGSDTVSIGVLNAS